MGTGLDFSLYRRGTLKRRIESRLRATGCSDYLSYIAVLNRQPQEYDRLVDAVAINVTEFFRDPETFEALKGFVIPEIVRLKAAQGRRIIRAWSAGAAQGEEAYSLAILFLEVLGEEFERFQVKVYGTDIDPTSLTQAKAGLYPPSALRRVEARILKRYFHPVGDRVAVAEEVKALTRFHPHNLVSDAYLQHVDLILCRNVVIYFTRPLQEFVYSNFALALNGGGFLVLGRVESLWGNTAGTFEPANLRERIYRKGTQKKIELNREWGESDEEGKELGGP